jgi:hypothetical protein
MLDDEQISKENDVEGEAVPREQDPLVEGEAPGDWPDLDALHARLRADNSAWAERLDTVQTQLGTVQPLLATLAEQYEQLAIEEDIHRLRAATLGGAGLIQSGRFDFDMERYLALIWPVAADPRPDLAGVEGGGHFQVYVSFTINDAGRACVRVQGEKRLEANLPVSREKLRSVLVQAIQRPRHVPGPDEGVADIPDDDAPASEAPDQPVESASPRPGDPDEQAPPEEQVIPVSAADDPSAGGTA